MNRLYEIAREDARERTAEKAKGSERQCATCGKSFEATRSDARFCSSRCRVAAHRSAYPLQPLQPLHSAETARADLDELREIEQRLDQGRIDASEIEHAIERTDRILQAHEAVTIRANSLGIRLEKLLDDAV